MLEKIIYDSKQQNINYDLLYSDVIFLKKFLNEFESFREVTITECNTDLINIFIDIESAINKAEIEEDFIDKLNLFKQGYSIEEISNITYVNARSLYRQMNKFLESVMKELKR